MNQTIFRFMLCGMLLAFCLPAEAQQPGKVFRIGFLTSTTASGSAGLLEVFRQELSKLGWIEGKNITIEYRFAEQKSERLPKLAADLVRLKVDLIVVAATPSALAAKKATAHIPVVMANAGDPVGVGLIASLARPGGNVTGLSSLSTELNTKRLEILKDAVPKLARVGLLLPPGRGGPENWQLKEIIPAALALKLKLEEIEAKPDAKGLEAAFQTAKQKQVGAIMTTTGRRFFAERKRIVELAGKHQLPAIYFQKEFVDVGGLMSYGVDFDDLYRRAAVYVDKLTTFLTIVSPASAQQSEKTWKIGVLVSGTASINAPRDEALRRGLRDFGYEEGKNIVFAYRYAEGKTDRLPKLAKELIAEKPDVVVVGGTAVAVAAKNATSTIPIVVAGAGDLVEAGLIKSFMYPGGNVTGVARLSADFFGDRLKLIKEVVPKAAQVTALSNPNNSGHGRSLKDAELGARSSAMTFGNVSARSADELDKAIAAAAQGGASALFLMTDAMFNSNLARIAQLALKHRLPSVYDRTEYVEAGGLMSNGVNLSDLSRRAAEYVHQILKGTKPGDLTLVQPTKFDLAVNLKTAQQIGLTIPPNVLARADKVIR